MPCFQEFHVDLTTGRMLLNVLSIFSKLPLDLSSTGLYLLFISIPCTWHRMHSLKIYLVYGVDLGFRIRTEGTDTTTESRRAKACCETPESMSMLWKPPLQREGCFAWILAGRCFSIALCSLHSYHSHHLFAEEMTP